MLYSVGATHIARLLLLGAIPLALSHGHGDHRGATANIELLNSSHSTLSLNSTGSLPQSYFAFPQHGPLMLSHIALTVAAWLFVLPIGVMLSVARSPLAAIVKLSFLGLHCVGLLLGKAYSSKTPDLYKDNFHNTFGWIVTWIVLVQCIIDVIKLAASVGETDAEEEEEEEEEEEQAALSRTSSGPFNRQEQIQPYRYFNDSGHFTASESSRSQSISSVVERNEEEQQQKLHQDENLHADIRAQYTEKLGLLGNAKVQRVASRLSGKVSKRTTKVLNTLNTIIDSTSLLIGFVAIVSGAVVYGGVFRGSNVFNGLAHSVKGGIFFWYGILTLGRWMGCFADMGWAWNVKPPVGVVNHRTARIPSAEFVESFVIFLYGASNVWLEHLAAWGSTWSAQDFEHVSISIMFFGGGLCGMLVESRKVREFLNTAIVTSPAAHGLHHTRELLMPPKAYAISTNPFPGLVILLLGLMMNSHHQSSMVSSMVHKQWGTLFVGFALARAVTYVMMYISPPTSYLPSRPPSELVSSFCLISGGLIFIASNKDTVAALEHYNIHAMFPFTVTMGFTAFLMAWAIIVLAVKGWALRRTQGLDLTLSEVPAI